MIQASIHIDKPIHEVYAALQLMLAQAFETEPDQLLKAQIKKSIHTTGNNNMTITQTVDELIEPQRIVFSSISQRDTITTIYNLEDLEDEGTTLITQEQGTSQKSRFRSWNYRLMEFPFLKKGSERKLNLRLHAIKQRIENS